MTLLTQLGGPARCGNSEPCRIGPACSRGARTRLCTDRLEIAVLLGLGIAFFSSQINNPVVLLIFSSLKKIGGLGVDEPKCG